MLVKLLYLAAAFGAIVIGVTLWAWGQPLICTCGYVKLWEGFIWADGNSQHIADWYTLSHVLHGVLVILLGRVTMERFSYPFLLVLAIVSGVGWEIVEHTDWVLNRFRETTVYQGYIGDSVLNAVADYIWMWVGFFGARALATVWIVVLVVVMEGVAALFGRDCLTFTTLQLVYPIEAIKTYQYAIHPDQNLLQK